MSKEGEGLIGGSEPTPPEKTKAELFAENPDAFIDARNLIVAMQRTPKGPALLMQFSSRHEAIMTLGELETSILAQIIQSDQERAKQRIVPAKGGIINAVRNRMVGR